MNNRNDILSSMGLENKIAPEKPFKQQPNMNAYKLPNRNGLGNDMGQIPNAINGSRYVYCTNAHGDEVAAHLKR